MAKYSVQVGVKASGFQFFDVEAESEAEAIEKVKAGKGTYQHEELEVSEMDFHDTSVEEVERG